MRISSLKLRDNDPVKRMVKFSKILLFILKNNMNKDFLKIL